MAKEKVARIKLVLLKDKGKNKGKSNAELEVRLWELLHQSKVHDAWGIDSIAVNDEEAEE